jgi:F-type H+/Na+-transporting ATPase subunit alpha
MNASVPTIVEQFKKKLHEELEKVVVTESTVSSDGAHVIRFADGVAEISGLRDPRIGQVLDFPKSTERAEKAGDEGFSICGIVEDITENTVKCLVLGEERFISQGDIVTATPDGDQLRMPVSHLLLGHTWDPLGRPLDNGAGAPDLKGALKLPIERSAPGITDRSKIDAQLVTGIKAVDMMLPIGRGQRMLLIGDRGTGKTSIALDAIIRQNELNRELNGANDGNDEMKFRAHSRKTVYCVYVGIGKKASEINQIRRKLQENNALTYTVIVTTMANDPAPLSYVCPFSGCTIAEYFRDIGRNALIVYDDLSKHATAYRQLSLILKRPPGREAYPGDIFFLHSRLLERAARIRDSKLPDIPWSSDYQGVIDQYVGWEHGEAQTGNGSLTALPLVETKLDDYATYIATNIISITDGQIFLSTKLKNEGSLPAINPGISVSRVRSAWDNRLRKRAEMLRIDMAEYRSSEEFAKMDASGHEEESSDLKWGRLCSAYFMQHERPWKPDSIAKHPFTIERLLVGLILLRDKGILDIPRDGINRLEESIWDEIRQEHTLLAGKDEGTEQLEMAIAALVRKHAPRFAATGVTRTTD